MTKQHTDWLPLAAACQQTRTRRARMYELALAGHVQARQQPNGRWEIRRDSLAKLRSADEKAGAA